MALLGVGYMGGSLALGARRAQLTTRVAGYDPDPDVGTVARERGIVDEMALRPGDAVRGAKLVVLAGPVRSLASLAAEVAGEVGPDALVIDIGSVKASVVAAIDATSLAGRFVGCHPLAGTEASGPASADATLYAGQTLFLVPGAENQHRAGRAGAAILGGAGRNRADPRCRGARPDHGSR